MYQLTTINVAHAWWAGLGPQGQCLTLVVYLTSLLPRRIWDLYWFYWQIMLLLKLCFLHYLLIFLLSVAIQSDSTLTFWDNCKKNEIMQKWPISFINLFFWNLSCTINCVQLKIISINIYSYMSIKHPLPAIVCHWYLKRIPK